MECRLLDNCNVFRKYNAYFMLKLIQFNSSTGNSKKRVKKTLESS